jgi:hypothetical protein
MRLAAGGVYRVLQNIIDETRAQAAEAPCRADPAPFMVYYNIA